MNIKKMLISNARKAMLDNITALDKKTLQRELESHLKLEFEYKDEIERLNNIINELEYCIEKNIKITKQALNFEQLDEFDKKKYNRDILLFEMVLDKLKELKGSDKE